MNIYWHRTQNENKPLNLKKVLGPPLILLSAERKERLKPVSNEGIKKICDKKTSDSKYIFGENVLENMKEAKDSFRISNSLVNKSTTYFQKLSYQSDSECSFGYASSGACARFSTSHSLNFHGCKMNHQNSGQQSSSSTKYVRIWKFVSDFSIF